MMLMLLCFVSSLMEISRAFSSLDTTCSMDGRCFLWPVHDRASFKLRSNASVEYSPFNLGSAKSSTLPSWISAEAWERQELQEHHPEAVYIPCSIHLVVVAVFRIDIAKGSPDFGAYRMAMTPTITPAERHPSSASYPVDNLMSSKFERSGRTEWEKIDSLQATIDQVWSRHQGQATIDQQTPLFSWKDANSDCATSLRSSERQVFTAGSMVQASTETIQQLLAFRDATAHPPIAWLYTRCIAPGRADCSIYVIL